MLDEIELIFILYFAQNNHTICPKKSNHVSFYNDKYNCWGRNPNLPAILLIIAILEEIEGMFSAPDFDVDDER